MSTDAIRRTNLGAVECERRPQLPDGFQRSSTRVGAKLGATLTGLSVYELPSGQAVRLVTCPFSPASDLALASSSRFTVWASPESWMNRLRLMGAWRRWLSRSWRPAR